MKQPKAKKTPEDVRCARANADAHDVHSASADTLMADVEKDSRVDEGLALVPTPGSVRTCTTLP